MISQEYPYLPISVELRGHSAQVSALVDTGFSGSLVVPATWLNLDIGLPDGFGSWEMADGSIVRVPVFLGRVQIIGLAQIPQVAVTMLGNDYIIGRRIINRFEVVLDHGQRVIVRP